MLASTRAHAEWSCCLQVGLRLLLAEGSILKCHADALDARWHAEMGASATILDAGYNIASLQKRCGAGHCAQHSTCRQH